MIYRRILCYYWNMSFCCPTSECIPLGTSGAPIRASSHASPTHPHSTSKRQGRACACLLRPEQHDTNQAAAVRKNTVKGLPAVQINDVQHCIVSRHHPGNIRFNLTVCNPHYSTRFLCCSTASYALVFLSPRALSLESHHTWNQSCITLLLVRGDKLFSPVA